MTRRSLCGERMVGTTTLWHMQIEIANSVRDNFRTAVRSSCNGAGKTFISAAIVAWFSYVAS